MENYLAKVWLVQIVRQENLARVNVEEISNDTVVNQPLDNAPVEQEKMLSQSEVNKIVGAAKLKEREKLQREYESKRGEPQETSNTQYVPFDESKIEENVYKRLEQKREEEQRAYQEDLVRKQAQEFVDSYQAKIAPGREAYSDFDEVVGTVNPKEFFKVIKLAADVEGTADVMYELAKDPDRLARIDYMANKSEAHARKMMQEFADSLRQNKEARESVPNTHQPLPKLKSSIAGTNSAKEPATVADFKRASWLQTR